jgi:hypothetical protein
VTIGHSSENNSDGRENKENKNLSKDSNLEIFFEPLTKRIGHLVKSDKLLDPQHLSVVASRAGVKPLDNGADVSKDTGVHQR